MVSKMVMGLLVIGGLAMASDDKAIKPLEDALWRGLIQVEVSGPMYTQYLANQIEDRLIVGFTKEKGQLDIKLQLEIHFLVNALGEYEMLVTENFGGKYFLQREFRRKYKEEIKSKGRMSYQQKVQASQIKLTKVDFNHEATFDRERFDAGSFRLLPSGRLDKKGALRLAGEFTFEYEGKGQLEDSFERQPPSKKEKNHKTVADVRKSFTLPVSFDVQVPLNRKPVSGAVTVVSNVQDPFPKTEGDDTSSVVYKNAVTTQGSYQLTPLFSKKK